MRGFFIWLFCLVACFGAAGQVTVVEDSRSLGRILAENEGFRPAAEMASEFIARISDARVPIFVGSDLKARKGDVVIRRSNDPRIQEDGYCISTLPGYLVIEAKDGKAARYGVATVLERWLGCDYWSENEFSVRRSRGVSLPRIDMIDNPAFRYRQSQNYALATDPMYRTWMRLEGPKDEFAGGLWVHTFDRLLPSAVYGREHPEYYAWFGGERHPGKASQWCLTNDELFEVVAQRIDSIFKANPGMDMISVSQNDGNHTYCTCDKCREIDEREGAHSSTVIHFLNKLARRFPDKQFSTLAYLYTMHPPKHIKPEPNVNIMLCDIDCYREVPLGYNASGRDFLQALEGWSKITDNIFVWDYGINFDGTSTPFPNFHIIAPNIRTFRDNNVKMHFSQIAGYRGGDMSELRTYMISKLMWNPDADADSLMRHFIDGYYGAAAPQIYQYLKLQEGALLGSRIPLWIYDSPVTHAEGFLNPYLRERYDELFDSAEAAVQDDSVLLGRVQRSRLPLQYSELEIARTSPGKDVAELKARLDTFEQRSLRYGLTTINERNNSPVDYCRLYRERYLPKANDNLASGAKVTFSKSVPAPYDRIADAALTDGLFGGATYKDSWVGWEGEDVTIVLDLGRVTSISAIDSDFLHQLGQWILLPRAVSYSVSTDGENWSAPILHEIPEDSDPKVKFVNVEHRYDEPVRARYVKVDVTGTKQCPHWHYGVGNPCWFFIDEITVR